MIELTDQQRQALDEQKTEPLRIVDPRTKATYVLLRAEDYERLKGLLADEEINPREGYALADEVFREDWDDPKMADYDRYEENKR